MCQPFGRYTIMTKTRSKYILKSYVDEEGFDADGIGDYIRVVERYQSLIRKKRYCHICKKIFGMMTEKANLILAL